MAELFTTLFYEPIFNGLMAVPNLVSLLLLAPVIVAETGKYINEP